MKIDWEAILRSREARADRQQAWLKKYKTPLVSFTLNIPGPCKQSPIMDDVHEVGLKILCSILPVHHVQKLCENTGSEAMMAVPMDVRRIKSVTVDLEEHHPLGRIFDMDVIDSQGKHLSRQDMGLQPRRCLLCHEDARICTRNRTHPIPLLLERITDMAETFFRTQQLSSQYDAIMNTDIPIPDVFRRAPLY